MAATVPRALLLVLLAQCATPSVGLTAPRPVARVVKPPRLPVWPVLNGLAFTALDLLGRQRDAARLEEQLGGRVAPMSLDARDADPFVLLVHHRHRFSPWDPIRPIFRLLLPEGFPAHPHRGFETVTMTVHGGLVHRDSLGVKQRYGDGEVQWLTAGEGILHEEMWSSDERGRAELYQLWLNLPSKHKMAAPRIQVFAPAQVSVGERAGKGTGEGSQEAGVHVRVMGGSHASAKADVDVLGTDVLLLRATLAPRAVWRCAVPATHNAVLYCARGLVDVAGEELDVHHLAYLPARVAAGTDGVLVSNPSDTDDAEVVLLAGEPTREPIAADGTWVMNTQAELDQASRDYASGRFGVPWPHTLTDDEWRAHLERAA